MKILKALIRVDDDKEIYANARDDYDRCEAVREELETAGLTILDCIPAQEIELDRTTGHEDEPWFGQSCVIVPNMLLRKLQNALRFNKERSTGPLVTGAETLEVLYAKLCNLKTVGTKDDDA